MVFNRKIHKHSEISKTAKIAVKYILASYYNPDLAIFFGKMLQSECHNQYVHNSRLSTGFPPFSVHAFRTSPLATADSTETKYVPLSKPYNRSSAYIHTVPDVPAKDNTLSSGYVAERTANPSEG